MTVSKKKNRWVLPAVVMLTVALLAGAVFAYLVYRNEYTLELKINGETELVLEYGSEYEDPGARCCYYGTIFRQEPLEIPVTVEGYVDQTKTGTYEIVYRAEHEGMSASETRLVTVVDTVDPEIALLGDPMVILPVGAEYQEPGCKAMDNYSGDLSSSVVISGNLNSGTPGSYTLTYTVSDSSGNTVSIQRTVTYEDVMPPELTLLGAEEITLNTGSLFEDPGVNAVDDCDGDVNALVTVSGTVDTGKPGSYILSYTVTDAAGNTASVQRTVTVKDMTPPELSLLGEETVYLTIGNRFEEPGYTASDAVDGDLVAQVVITDDINVLLPGTYSVNYSVTDAAGNTTQASRTVVMTDIVAQTPGGIIYLTYDDGPSGYTSGLLDLLDKYGVKATFFVVNSKYGGTMARAASSGHTIAIHSASHNYDKIYASEEAFFNDLYYMQSIIQSNTGQTPMMIRFPGGSSNSVSYFNPGIMTRLVELVEEKGFRYFDWNVSSNDAGGVTHGWVEVAYNVIRGVSTRGTSVVLMHDSNGMCIRATERIIQWGLANGYTFAALTYGGPGCHHRVRN